MMIIKVPPCAWIEIKEAEEDGLVPARTLTHGELSGRLNINALKAHRAVLLHPACFAKVRRRDTRRIRRAAAQLFYRSLQSRIETRQASPLVGLPRATLEHHQSGIY